MVEKLTCFKGIKTLLAQKYYIMVKLCRLWSVYVSYGNFLNKLIKKIQKVLLLKNFNKTPLGETGHLGSPYFLLTGA